MLLLHEQYPKHVKNETHFLICSLRAVNPPLGLASVLNEENSSIAFKLKSREN